MSQWHISLINSKVFNKFEISISKLSCSIYYYFRSTKEPIFCARNVAFHMGGALFRDRNQYMYIYVVKWAFQIGWPLSRLASQKGFHSIYNK